VLNLKQLVLRWDYTMGIRDILKDSPDPANLLLIDEHDLETELGGCSSLQYMFSELALDAENIYNESTLTLETHELQLAQKFREEKDKLTETDIKRMFRGDELWLTLKRQNNTDEIKYKKLEKAAKAFEKKNDACRSLNARQLFKAGKGMQDL
jgi:hypothetical protein